MRADLSVEAPAVTLQDTDDVSHLHEFKVGDRCDDLLEPSHSLRDRRSRIPRRGREFPAKSLVVGTTHRIGAPGRTRTYDARFRKPTLYPLSYGGLMKWAVFTCGNSSNPVLSKHTVTHGIRRRRFVDRVH